MHRVLLIGSAVFLVTLAAFLIANYEDVDARTGMPHAEGVAGQRNAGEATARRPEPGTVHGAFAELEAGTHVRVTTRHGATWSTGSMALGAGGRFEHAYPQAGTPFRMEFRRDGFAPLVVDVEALEAGSARDLGRLAFDAGFTLDAVVENDQGERLANAAVRVAESWSTARAQTDGQGRFRIEALPKRAICLLVRAEGYPVHRLCVDGATREASRRLIVRPGGTLAGRVQLASGRPAAGARVTITPTGLSAYAAEDDPSKQTLDCDARGRFRITLQSGSYGIHAYGPQYRREGTARRDVQEGQSTDVEIRLP